MTTHVSPEVAALRIRAALEAQPDRTIAGVGAREKLRTMAGVSPSQFAKGLAYNLTVADGIFIVLNNGRCGSTYQITDDAEQLGWLPVAKDSHYLHRRSLSLADKVNVLEQMLIAQGAAPSSRGAAYAARRAVDGLSVGLEPLVRQTALAAGVPEDVIERWLVS